MQKSEILYQGAEAIIILEDNKIIKKRIKKSYRIPEIDNKLRTSRTKKEAKLMERASQIINVPNIIAIDKEEKQISMDFIQGKKLSVHLDKFNLKKQLSVCKQIGESVAKLHDNGIIHGDLTTSNMILSENCRQDVIYFIDFGLGFNSSRTEDKAVDLHLLQQALEAKHFSNWQKLFNAVLQGYKQSKHFETAIKQLKKVESRGRYKDKVQKV